MFFWSYIKKQDWIIIGTVLALCAVGLLTIYSVNFGKPGFAYFTKQILFVALGFFVMLAVSFFDFRIFKNYQTFLITVYFIGIGLLLGVLFLGKNIRGTAGWFSFFELNFQPVELVKIVIILILAKYFSSRHIEMYRVRHIIASLVYVLIPAILILMQPDLGSAIILGAIWIGLVILAGIKVRHLILVLIGAIVLFSIAWFGALRPYQKDRILTFINPQRDPFGASYNLIQSKIAIGAGGLLGQGLGRGSQGRLDFLPEKHTDFIFAAYAEEWGLIGVLFLFFLFGILFYRLTKAALRGENNFSRIFCAGVCLMIFSQVFINIGMALGLLPITGISLPFLSYGGSGLLMNFIALGIVQNIIISEKK
jgi:rod shape determining protein RodA